MFGMQPVQQPVQSPEDEHMDVKTDKRSAPAVADQLGVSRVTVYRWIRAGRLPAVRVGGGAYRISPADVDRMVTVMGDAK
jgi:excisionase family DNA binding protein